MLIAAVNFNPWGKEHGNIGNAWNKVIKMVNNAGSITRKFTMAVHKGCKPPQTHFSNSETGIYHSQIDLICGLKEAAEKKKEQDATEKSNQAAHNECEGHLAWQAALTTFTQGINNPSLPPLSPPVDPNMELDNSACENQAESSPGPSQQADLVIEALKNATKIENTQHETLLTAIEENSDCLTELAQGVQAAVKAQVESNQLMPELISQNQQAPKTSKRHCDNVTMPEEVPQNTVKSKTAKHT
ncbi:hypothetical protein RHS01_10087 [Rhizoctonia solani]|uniref:Uncharacterized protein n=1 Tax=Rhizoctonia solani TaxID=456999 RepID=A0A8H7I5Q7_9AGAM|nr:hypothetical protein RHS01_10087 [Rhizoctonia solani]